MGYAAYRFRGTSITLISTVKALRPSPSSRRGGYRRTHPLGRPTTRRAYGGDPIHLGPGRLVPDPIDSRGIP
jgi:hypothetical protein